ncbi:hypothetical protein E4K72_14270 [Oxalobacteraceae bacterium OM1]|nr:hypothetical protein E4K72_14270 [Oxalobacteraceae bacterium OM1]
MFSVPALIDNFKTPACLAISIVALGTLAACGGGQSAAEAEYERDLQLNQQLTAVRGQILSEIGTPVAATATDCGVMPIGMYSCGIPEHYIVYSKKASNEPRLQQLVDTYTDLDKHRGVIAACSGRQPPELVVIDGQCRAVRSSQVVTPPPGSWW